MYSAFFIISLLVPGVEVGQGSRTLYPEHFPKRTFLKQEPFESN